ncbi:metallophosphoesterase [Geomicrobium sediminis]|uniref:Diadenosine tetraphosphatase ApaH/serine/threonine PP2A family protein phosphatase n=1 Tax=Geomicrobium sediminis TaxID=1347788 RepID=A0ABS2P7X3_9BACL|nr:metallophosphoesterase [Geomicrobium sediminis]MBM7631518.1 diadenosine tetraphosphatase ApaH/serine/threonine PP2A family protein phosphatase [Geomicrobium sediminis]
MSEQFYDIIGDTHGCYEECLQLIRTCGYKNGIHPENRTLVFIGDITDRGPDSLQMINLVHWLVYERKTALYVPGNHCNKLYRYFKGNRVVINHGLETTVAELHALSQDENQLIKRKFMQLYEQSSLYLVLDHGNVVCSHAGIKRQDIGKNGRQIQSFVLYGDVDHQSTKKGQPPIRRDWALNEKRTMPWVIYGHTPVISPRVVNATINIDTGCVFGGKLTAFHYPELTFSTVSSNQPLQVDKFNSYEHEETIDDYK